MFSSHRSYFAAILLLACSPAAFAQETKPEQRPTGPGPRGMPASPKKGPTDLPILPALPALDDASFYAEADVPHGKVEQATYKTGDGKGSGCTSTCRPAMRRRETRDIPCFT